MPRSETLPRAREEGDVVRVAGAERQQRKPAVAGAERVRDARRRWAHDDAAGPHRMPLVVAEQQRPAALELPIARSGKDRLVPILTPCRGVREAGGRGRLGGSPVRGGRRWGG